MYRYSYIKPHKILLAPLNIIILVLLVAAISLLHRNQQVPLEIFGNLVEKLYYFQWHISTTETIYAKDPVVRRMSMSKDESACTRSTLICLFRGKLLPLESHASCNTYDYLAWDNLYIVSVLFLVCRRLSLSFLKAIFNNEIVLCQSTSTVLIHFVYFRDFVMRLLPIFPWDLYF